MTTSETWDDFVKNNPDEAVQLLGDGELPGIGRDDPRKKGTYARRSCQVCIRKRLNTTICCPSHPETKVVNLETGLCPNLDVDTGMCIVYNTDEYPAICRSFFCAESTSNNGWQV